MKHNIAPENAGARMAPLAGVIAELLNTTECRHAVNSVMTETLRLWGAESITKKTVAAPVTWAIEKIIAPVTTGSTDREMAAFVKRMATSKAAAEQVPVIANRFLSAVADILKLFEDMPDEQKGSIFRSFASQLDAGKAGDIITSLANIAGGIIRNQPTLLSDTFLPLFRQFLVHTDTGEIKAVFDDAGEDMAGLIESSLDLVFEYPAKLITVLSFLPGMSNLISVFAEGLLKRFNSLPPDVLADILLSFFKELDGASAGRLTNNVCEVIRQVHTGSALIGEAGSPQFSVELKKKIKLVFREIDPALFFKAANAVADGKEAARSACLESAEDHPELMAAYLLEIAASANRRIKSSYKKMTFMESLDGSDLFDALSDGVAGLNTYEMAEIINLACLNIQALHGHDPDMMKSLIREFVNTLDLYDLSDTIRLLSDEFGDTLQPLTLSVLPVLITGIFKRLNEETDEHQGDIDDARQQLYQFIMGGSDAAASTVKEEVAI